MQRIAVRYYWGRWISPRTDWNGNRERFERLNRSILEQADALDESRLERRVLIPPQIGLEDSSRYWSVAMTLEHLLIVGRGMSRVITELSNGRVPEIVIDPAKAKPQGEKSGQESREAYREFVNSVMSRIDSEVQDRKSAATLVHPWFGPMNAHQFHWLLAQHSAIHYRQVKEILSRL